MENFEELLKKAENGDAEAQYQVSDCYLYGLYGVTVDQQKARMWFTRAESKNKKIMQRRLLYNWIIFAIMLINVIIMILTEHLFNKYLIGSLSVISCCLIIFLVGFNPYHKIYSLSKENEVLKAIDNLNSKVAETGSKEAKDQIKAIKKKKDIDDIVKELNAGQISREHAQAQVWYYLCLALFISTIIGFVYYMRWNINTISEILEPLWPEMLVRVLISMSFLSMIFILINQAARSRKTMVLLSREIQEYTYIGALLKGKVGLFPDRTETDTRIDETLDNMITQHLEMQKLRLAKEDHSEVKDITPEVLNFF
ncbi:MAG: sel1 repeat family protein, partial [Bacteroidales bacterium]|nr:sel1 repeat family protein [Bacteroidales bacterium]